MCGRRHSDRLKQTKIGVLCRPTNEVYLQLPTNGCGTMSCTVAKASRTLRTPSFSRTGAVLELQKGAGEVVVWAVAREPRAVAKVNNCGWGPQERAWA